MVKIFINQKEYEVPVGLTIIQACDLVGVEIPRFCFHEKLSIAGNCRMCLVQVEKSSKPVASCAMPIADGMVIYTNNDFVKNAREGVMEFLLINHPLDCPICDQGGECDLQDQAMLYGSGDSRFCETKRAVPDKNFGPLIKTKMNRCIHCTRCVRFSEEISGTNELGAFFRGEHMEVNTYIGDIVASELSGNVIDLCPVGALTAKPYAFKARSWELVPTETIDVHDALGCNIRVDRKGDEVIRILPRLNENINEEWISDKTRFACDALKIQRLDRPLLRNKSGKFKAISWGEAIKLASDKLSKANAKNVGILSGDLTDLETMVVAKDLAQWLKITNIDCRQDGARLDNATRGSYLFNTTIAGIDHSDLCLIIGANPRYDAAVLNARIRKAMVHNNMKIALIGVDYDLSYDYEFLGNDLDILNQLESGKHKFSKSLKAARNPMIIIGSDAFLRKDGDDVIKKCQLIAQKFSVVREDWNGFNILHRAASRVGGLEIGFVSRDSFRFDKLEVLYLLGADEFDTNLISKDCFVIYQGHHGDIGANSADLILPGAAYTEKFATYLNVEGRLQRTNKVTEPVGEAEEDWVILSNIAKELSAGLKYTNLLELRAYMVEKYPHLAVVGQINPARWESVDDKIELTPDQFFTTQIFNYYYSNAIARNSKTMADCVAHNLERNGLSSYEEEFLNVV